MENSEAITNLSDAIEVAYNQMLVDAHHNLFLNKRLPIYKCIERLDELNHLNIRGWLALLTARKVLFIWERTPPYYSFPQLLVNDAESFLQNNLSLPDLKAKYDFEELTITGFYNDPETYTDKQKYSGQATLLACTEAQGILLFNQLFPNDLIHKMEEEIIQGYPDEMLRDFYIDCASMAVCAYSGISFDWDIVDDSVSEWINDFQELLNIINTTFDPEFIPEKRLEFWKWWLKEAIPQAWELAQQSSNQ